MILVAEATSEAVVISNGPRAVTYSAESGKVTSTSLPINSPRIGESRTVVTWRMLPASAPTFFVALTTTVIDAPVPRRPP